MCICTSYITRKFALIHTPYVTRIYMYKYISTSRLFRLLCVPAMQGIPQLLPPHLSSRRVSVWCDTATNMTGNWLTEAAAWHERCVCVCVCLCGVTHQPI